MRKPRPKLIATIVIIIVLLAFANVWFFIHSVDNTVDWLGDRVSAVEREQAKQKELMKQEPVAPVNTVTTIVNPVKKGDKGDKGENSVSTHTIEREVIVKEIPAPAALTPEIKCNAVKNRWEIRYVGDESWKVMNDEPTPCTINADILTQLYLNLRKE